MFLPKYKLLNLWYKQKDNFALVNFISPKKVKQYTKVSKTFKILAYLTLSKYKI